MPAQGDGYAPEWYREQQRAMERKELAARNEAQAEVERLLWDMSQGQMFTLLNKLIVSDPIKALALAREVISG